MPDQSLDQQTNPTSATLSATPDDTSANHPEAAQPSSVVANAPQASEGQMQQADVTINQDPIVGAAEADPGTTPEASGDNYDDEDAWPYRALQHEAKGRDLDASGKRDEIIARLRESDGGGSGSGETGDDVPRSEVPSAVVENGGIQKTSFGAEHSGILQGLSDERRSQQLSAIKGRADQSA